MLLLSWISLGFFAGIGCNLVYGEKTSAVATVSIAVGGAILGGLLLGFLTGRLLPDWVLFTSILPAVGGAAIALVAYQTIGSSARE